MHRPFIEVGSNVITELVHEDVTKAITGAVMRVLNSLNPGLSEKIYERALRIEPEQLGHQVESQTAFPVGYSGRKFGTLQPDLIVEGVVIAETEIVSAFIKSQFARLIGDLVTTDL